MELMVPCIRGPRASAYPTIGSISRPASTQSPLVARAIPDANRTRRTVAGQIDCALAGCEPSVEAIERVQLRLRQGRRLHEPPEQRTRFVEATKLDERVDREIGVAKPAKPV